MKSSHRDCFYQIWNQGIFAFRGDQYNIEIQGRLEQSLVSEKYLLAVQLLRIFWEGTGNGWSIDRVLFDGNCST